MRTVVKSVIRSFSASVTFHSSVMNRFESNDKDRLFDGRRPYHHSESLSIDTTKQLNNHNEFKAQSFSYSYKLHFSEEQVLNNLLDLEYDYYPDNSTRGDYNILNMEAPNINMDNNVTAVDIRNSLKTIWFVNNFVFNLNPEIFLICSNYINRLLDQRAVKKDLMSFITAAVYDLAVQRKNGQSLSEDRVSLLFALSRISINHLEDFHRMKLLLTDKLNGDLQHVTILDYLQLFLRCDFDAIITDQYTQLICLASIMGTSCELTYYTLSCQALSLISLAGRHIVLDSQFKEQYKNVLDKIPLIFLSPTRLTQFADSGNISEESIQNCAKSIIRYISAYYKQNLPINNIRRSNSNRQTYLAVSSQLESIQELDEDDSKTKKSAFDIEELLCKLHEVSLKNEVDTDRESHLVQHCVSKNPNKLSNKYKSATNGLHCHQFNLHPQQYNFKQKSVIVAINEDEMAVDSAFSSSSCQASVSTSPPNI